MNREYLHWFSKNLNREMEVLVFGDRGTKVLFFPTRKARFYDYENWGVIDALRNKIEAGVLQVFCMDSLDSESLYNSSVEPRQRIKRHLAYEKYIIEEIIPFINYKNQHPSLVVAGCSLGAFHAVNLSFRFPHLIKKVVGMSGRYDLTQPMLAFKDLFDGYRDEDIDANTPSKFIKTLHENQLKTLRDMEIILAIGKDDAFLSDNYYFSKVMSEKEMAHQLYVWEGEAHHPYQWKQMVQIYF
jgi:esterase/lipase superfamily enzyme